MEEKEKSLSEYQSRLDSGWDDLSKRRIQEEQEIEIVFLIIYLIYYLFIN